MRLIQHVEGFSPAETAEITGLDVVLQRDHRRRFPEWMPQRSGHARFDLFQLLQMTFVKDAAEYKIGPGQSYSSGEWVAHSALQFALELPNCISGTLAKECTIPGANNNDIREYTARRVFAEAFGRPRLIANEYAFIGGDGENWFGPSLESYLSTLQPGDPRRGKPLLSIHIPSFAARVVSRLPRPAAQILSPESDQ